MLYKTNSKLEKVRKEFGLQDKTTSNDKSKSSSTSTKSKASSTSKTSQQTKEKSRANNSSAPTPAQSKLETVRQQFGLSDNSNTSKKYIDYSTEPDKAYTSAKNKLNTKTTITNGMTDEERKKRINEINTELNQLSKNRSGLSRASMYGNVGDMIAKNEARQAELKKELKELQRVGTFTASEMKQFEIDDAKAKKSALPTFNPTGRITLAEADTMRESVSKSMALDKEIEELERQKSLYDYMDKFGDVVHKDDYRDGGIVADFKNFNSQWRANYRSRDINEQKALAFNAYINNPTEENRQIALAFEAFEKEYLKNNEMALDDEGQVLPLLSDSFASYVAQQKNAAGTAIPLGIVGAGVGALAGGAGAKAGWTLGYSLGSGIHSYGVIRGSLFNELTALGLDEETAIKLASDDALIESMIESGETAKDWAFMLFGGIAGKGANGAMKATNKAAKAASKFAAHPVANLGLNIAKGTILNAGTEYLEEGAQGAVSRATREKSQAMIDNEIGQYGKGNIDLYDRPIYKNKDGSISTVDSVTFTIDGKYVVLPTIVRDENGKAKRLETDEEILAHYENTGEYLGEFDTLEESNIYANRLHNSQAYMYSDNTSADADDSALWGGIKVVGDAIFGGNTEARDELHEQGVEGFKTGLVAGSLQGTARFAISSYAAAKTDKTRNEIADFVKKDEKTLTAVIEEGKARGKGTVSAKIAEEVEQAKEKGTVTRSQVKRLLASNDVYRQASAPTTSTASYERLEILSRNNEQIAVEDVKKVTGFGEEGSKLVAELANKDGVTFRQAENQVKTAYMAGMSNADGKKVSFVSDVQIDAFTAGKKDRANQELLMKAKAKNATVYNGAFHENEYTKNYTDAEKTMISTFSKVLRMDVDTVDKIIASVVNGREYEANAEHQDGRLQISNNRDASAVVYKMVMHEGGHRMRQLAPTEFGVLMDALYERAEKLGRRTKMGVSQGLLFDKVKSQHDNAGIAMNTSGYMEEIAVRELETIFDSPEAFNEWYAEISENQKAKTAFQRWMNTIAELIEDIKRAITELVMPNKANAIKELERIKELYANALKAAEKAASERAKAQAKQSAEAKAETKNKAAQSKSVETTKTKATDGMRKVLGDGDKFVGVADGQAYVTNGKDILPSPTNRSVFIPVNDVEAAKTELGATESNKTSANISKILASDSFVPVREKFVDGTLKNVGEVRVFTDQKGREIALEKNVAEYFEGYNLEATFRGGKPYAIKATDNDGNVVGVALAIWMNTSGQKYDITDADVKLGDEDSNTDDELDWLFDTNFSLKGTRADGIEVYETSKEVMNMPVKDRKKLYLRLMSKEHAGRTARFVRNGHTYYAEFDKTNLSKAMYGDDRSSESGLKALTRVGADGDIFDLVENSTYDHSSPDTKNHSRTDYFDYFIKTVQIDNKVYDLLADVKKQYGKDGGYVYTLVLTDNKKIEVAPTEASQIDALKVVETTSEDMLSQKPNSVKSKFSLKNSIEETKDLIAVHNTSASQLEDALTRGQFVMPSMAVTNKSHTAFGDISVVFYKDTINPENDAANKLYGSDAWTPTQTTLKINPKFDNTKTEAVVKNIKASIGKGWSKIFDVNGATFKNAIRTAQGSVYGAYAENIGVQTAYAIENGIIQSVPEKNGKIDVNALKETLDAKLNKDEVWREYKKWLGDISNDIITSYDRASTEDILNNMRAQPETSKEFNLSESGELTVPAVRYSSIEEMRSNKSRLSDNAEAATQVTGKEFVSWASNIANKSGVNSKTVIKAINSSFNSRYDVMGIKNVFSKSGVSITQNDAKALQDLYKKAVELPTRYFEAKPHRAVGINEIARVVLPSNTSESIKSMLTEKGVSYSEYEQGNSEARTNELNSIEGAMFSLKDSDYLKAVKNGDMETAQKMVEEAAKEAGYIGTYYHGSKSDFTVFSKERGGKSNSNAGIGFWFTESEEGAKIWADESWWGDGEESKVYKTYLRLNNPKVYETADTKAQRDELYKGYESIDKEMSLYDSIYYFEDGRRYHSERYDYDTSKRRHSGIYAWDAFKAIVKKYDTDTIDYYLSKVDESEREIVKQDAERYLELSQERKALENQITELRYYDAYELFRTDIYKQIGLGAEDANIGGTGKYVENKDEMLKKYVDKLKQEGYDGIVIKNTSFDSRFFGEHNNQHLVFDSEQVKSAEPVTYDDNGNVIPLSERFNTQNDDIRYSLKDSEGKTLTEAQQEYFKDSKVRDENGNLLVMYQGAREDFTVFDRKKSSYANLYGRGFYFTKSESHASQYGDTRAYYLNIKHPVSTTDTTITKSQLRKFLQAVTENEDYSFENYGYGATVDSVLQTTYGKSDFLMLNDVSQTAIGDLVEAIELFNEVNGTDYDGIVLHTETVTFNSEQAKLTSNKKPTNNPDINFSLKEIKDKYADKTDHLYIYEKKNTISIDNMVVKKEYRNQGIGTDILNDIIDYADRVQKTITLTPTSEFGTKERLKKWYKANGFVENKGRNTDFTISDTMYRLPSDASFSLKGGIQNPSKWTTEFLDTVEDVRDGKKNATSRLYKYVKDGTISTKAYEEMIETYGAIKKGENPHRDVTVPKKTADDKKVSQTVRTILEAKATPDEAVPTIEKMVEDGVFSYDAYTDKQAINDAEAYIKEHGWVQSFKDWIEAVNQGEVSKELTTTGWALYNNAANTAATTTSEDERKTATETALAIIDGMVRHQRSAAQALQATRILKKLSPETQLYGVQKSVSAFQKELADKYGDKAPDLKIDEELAEQFINAKTPEERAKIEEEIYKDIGRQIPSRFVDKWNAWRYLAMLGNVRTHGRNIVGNAGFAPIVLTKNLTATAIESAVRWVSGKKTVRGKALVWGSKADKALLKAAWADYSNVADMISNGGKYNDSALSNQMIEEGRQVFKFKPLEWARKGNSWLLEKEDMWFAKPHYAYALAQYCKANNITADQIARGKAIAPARNYAIKEAQKATYRDTNAFSQMVSEWGRSNKSEKNIAKKAVNTVIEGILPFRKTPANILVRGVEYSPLGLLKGLSYDLVQVGKGKMSASQAIDNISAGLTGSGLLALGVYLAAQGLIRGHGEDDEEKEFKELMGHQSYALELPNGKSVTLDWLAPEALPFFIGVNIWETSKGTDEEMNLSTVLQAVSGISEPMLEMSCLQSLNDVFESVGYASSNDTSGLVSVLSSAATSYLTQGIPTLLGQAERTGEENRMTTYTEKDAFLTGDMQYTLGKVSAKIPFWDYNQIPYIDAWGRKEASGTALKRGLNNFLNPAYTSTIETSKMEEELLRLYEATGEGGVFPTRADKYFTVDGVRKDLTAEEYVRYATLKGGKSYKLISDLIKSEAYKKLSDEEKVKTIKETYDYANQKSKEAISNYKPDKWVARADEFSPNVGNYIAYKSEVSSTREENGGKISKQEIVDIIIDMAQNDSEAWNMYLSEYESEEALKAQKYGIDAELYIKADTAMYDMKADYIYNGKRVDGKDLTAEQKKKAKQVKNSRKNKIVKYLNSVCTNEKEYMFLLGTEYESVTDDRAYIKYFGKE